MAISLHSIPDPRREGPGLPSARRPITDPSDSEGETYGRTALLASTFTGAFRRVELSGGEDK